MLFGRNKDQSKGGLLEHVLGRSWVHILEDFEHVRVEFQGLVFGRHRCGHPRKWG